MTERDSLVEIPHEDLPKLLEIFKNHWPYAINVYYYLDNCIDWTRRNETAMEFLAPEGRWEDGTFVVAERVSVISLVFRKWKQCGY